MIYFLRLAVLLVAINSDQYVYGSPQTTTSNRIEINSFTTDIVDAAGEYNKIYNGNETEGYENNTDSTSKFQFSSIESEKLSEKCDGDRMLNGCVSAGVENGVTGAGTRRQDGSDVIGTPTTYPTKATTVPAKKFTSPKSKTIEKGLVNHHEVSETEGVQPTTATTSPENGEKLVESFLGEFIEVSSISTAIVESPESTSDISRKMDLEKSDKVSSQRPWDIRSTTPSGLTNFVKIRNSADEKVSGKRPRIYELLKLANDSLQNINHQPTPDQTSFGTMKYTKPLKMPPSTMQASLSTEINPEQLTVSTLHHGLIDLETFPQSFVAATISALSVFNGTLKNGTIIDKFSQEIPWPVKKEAIVEGDIILGGLMMVHEREDSITCGPVMPQGGIQSLEAMLFTLDQLNSAPEPLLPNITLGAHILDDCDKDTYGLEMAVDFIKG